MDHRRPACSDESREAETAETLAALFAHPVAAAATQIRANRFRLWPKEQEAVAHAVASRRAEFAAGRHCARTCLLALGRAAQAIAVGPDRAPVWPAGIIGSITHSAGLCAAVAALQKPLSAIGIDMEPLGAVKTDLARMILRPEEVAAWPGIGADGADAPTLYFCMKEAAYKALHPFCRRVMDFQEMRIERASSGGAFQPVPLIALPASVRLAGRYCVRRGRIHAAAWAQGDGDAP